MIGIVSEADAIAEGARPAASAPAATERGAPVLSRQVTEIMTRNVVTADEDASLTDVAALMLKHNVKRLPILRDRAVVGIVSRIDLLQALLSSDPAVAASGPALAAPPPSDDRLRAAVVAAVHGQTWSLARRADVVAKDGVVHLWGVVPGRDVADAYAAAARKVAGVRTVEVHMHVMPPR